jgi:hypothetical protein
LLSSSPTSLRNAEANEESRIPRGPLRFTFGPLKVNNVMKLSDDGNWLETTDVTMGSAPPRRTVEMNLRRQ